MTDCRVALPVGLLLMTFSPGCALFSVGSVAQLQAGWETAQQRAALAEARVEELADQLDTLQRQLAEKGLTDASGRSLGSLSEAVDRQQGQIDEVRFDGVETRKAIEQFSGQAERRQVYDELRLDRLEEVLVLDALPMPDLGFGAADPGARGGATSNTVDTRDKVSPGLDAPVPTDPAGRLAAAEERMANDQQVAARVVLEQTLAQVASDDPLVPLLHYRVAETFFNEERFKDAAKAFKAVADKFPNSEWASWATFRLGESFERLGKPDTARAFYEDVVTRYPATDAALEARSRLNP
jgi:TolA-binding protein